MKQIIIVRKDLNMSKGKMAAQVAHASMAFLTNQLRENSKKVLDCYKEYVPYDRNGKFISHYFYDHTLNDFAKQAHNRGDKYFYYKKLNNSDLYPSFQLCEKEEFHIESKISLNPELYNDWICGSFTKVILEAKNKYQLEKVYKIANELGLKEDIDYFPIKDNCYTELEPEEVDENGVGRTLTCIGFVTLKDEIADKISKKYQLYHDNKNDIDPWDGEKPHAKNGFVEKYCL